jgi:hypothetical protein
MASRLIELPTANSGEGEGIQTRILRTHSTHLVESLELSVFEGLKQAHKTHGGSVKKYERGLSKGIMKPLKG